MSAPTNNLCLTPWQTNNLCLALWNSRFVITASQKSPRLNGKNASLSSKPTVLQFTVGLSESAVQARVACLIPGSPIDRSCGEDDASPRAGAFFPYVPLDFVHEFAGPLHSQRPETSLCRCLLAFLSENAQSSPEKSPCETRSSYQQCLNVICSASQRPRPIVTKIRTTRWTNRQNDDHT